MFNYFDTNKDGYLLVSECINLWKLLAIVKKKIDVSKFGHKSLSFSQFIQFTKEFYDETLKSDSIVELPIKQLYIMIDRHGKGHADINELRAALVNI